MEQTMADINSAIPNLIIWRGNTRIDFFELGDENWEKIYFSVGGRSYNLYGNLWDIFFTHEIPIPHWLNEKYKLRDDFECYTKIYAGISRAETIKRFETLLEP